MTETASCLGGQCQHFFVVALLSGKKGAGCAAERRAPAEVLKRLVVRFF